MGKTSNTNEQDGLELKVGFGVKGGSSIDTGSGKNIASDLKKIASQISQTNNMPRITVGINTDKTLKVFQKELQNIVNKTKISVDIGANVKKTSDTVSISNPNITSKQQIDVDKQAISNSKVKQQLTKEEIEQERLKTKVIDNQTKEKLSADKVVISNSKTKLQLIKEENTIAKQAENNLKKQQKAELDSFVLLEKKKQKLNELSIYRQNNTKAEKLYGGQFDNLANDINAISDKAGLDMATAKFGALKSEITATGNAGKTAFGEFSQHFNKFKDWLLAGASVMTVVNALKNMVSTIKELDGAITDLQIATGSSRKDTEALLGTYTQIGKEMGATTLDVAKASDNWLRQGYDVAQSNELVKDSLMLSKLGQLDSTKATEALTAALKGCNLEAKDAITVVDKLTAIDLRSATSAGGLATSMSETAKSADLAGVSMSKLLGYLTVVKETTQDSDESVGTFAKTLFARMGNVKAGKFIDDESGESLSDVESVLDKLGVKLRDSKDEFRNFGGVLDEIGGKWNTYNSVQQHAIATALAG